MNDYGVNDVDDNYEDNGDDKYKGNKHERPYLCGGVDGMTLVAISGVGEQCARGSQIPI